MDLIHAVIFGIVEGITEFLPISSTGHLILTAGALGLSQTEFLKTFEISIQLGAILAVVVLYGKKFFLDLEVLKKVFTAFVPTAVVGFIFYKMIKQYLIGSADVVLISLFVGGAVMIFFEKMHKENKNALDDIKMISYPKAALIGLVQALAVIPGVSRAAATIVGGLALGLKRKTIVEFSFLLAVPTMLAATALDLFKNAGEFSSDQMGFLAVGFAVSFVVAMAAIKFLVAFIRNHSFILFGVYRMIIAVIFWQL